PARLPAGRRRRRGRDVHGLRHPGVPGRDAQGAARLRWRDRRRPHRRRDVPLRRRHRDRARGAGGRVGRRRCREAGLRDVHAQGDLGQPDAIAETIGERLYHGQLQLDGLNLTDEQIRGLSRIVFLACGTSYHAGLVGRYLLEEWARVPSESDIASEWRYRHAVIDENTLVIAIAQSGETIDTLA